MISYIFGSVSGLEWLGLAVVAAWLIWATVEAGRG